MPSNPKPTPELDGCRLKLNHAIEHLNRLNAMVDAFISTKPYGLGFQTDMKANDLVLTISIRENPPPEIGLVIGDAVHNLASCLDHLVCALARKNGGDCEKTAFPIHTNPDLYAKSSPRRIKDISEPARERIAALQPFKTRPDAPEKSRLAILYELDRIDKHRVLLVGATTMMPGAGMKFSFPTGPGVQILPVGSFRGPFEDGETIGRFHCVGVSPIEVDVQGDLTFNVGFGKGSGVATGDPVPQLLDRLWHRVKEVVEDFEDLF
jgi:hypothetical protein